MKGMKLDEIVEKLVCGCGWSRVSILRTWL